MNSTYFDVFVGIVATSCAGCWGAAESLSSQLPDASISEAAPLEAAPDVTFESPSPGVLPFPGSYDVHFTPTRIEGHDFGALGKCAGCEPCEGGSDARLDIQQLSSGYAAVVTPRGGVPQAMDVSVGPVAVTLSGEVRFKAVKCGSGWESWKQVTIPLGSNGLVLASAEVSGDGVVQCHTSIDSEVGAATPMTGRLEISPATRSPVAAPGLGFMKCVPITVPWTPFQIAFDEPVVESTVPALLTSSFGDAGASMNWSIPPPDPATPTWTGVIYAHGFLQDWDAVAANPTITWGVDAGYADRVGNVGAAVKAAVEMMDPGPRVSVHDFAAGTMIGNGWGEAKLATDAFTALCEGTTCLNIHCSGNSEHSSSGYFGRLSLPGASAVLVRYRILAEWGAGRIGRIDVSVPGQGIVASLPLDGTSAEFKSIGPVTAGCGMLSVASDWADALVTVPTGFQFDQLGFDIEMFNEGWEPIKAAHACGQDVFQSASGVALLIQRVQAM